MSHLRTPRLISPAEAGLGLSHRTSAPLRVQPGLPSVGKAARCTLDKPKKSLNLLPGRARSAPPPEAHA
jgi:hypothetical protein